MFRCVAGIAAVAVCAALVCATAAAAQVQPYGTSDYGGFRNILPPGALPRVYYTRAPAEVRGWHASGLADL